MPRKQPNAFTVFTAGFLTFSMMLVAGCGDDPGATAPTPPPAPNELSPFSGAEKPVAPAQGPDASAPVSASAPGADGAPLVPAAPSLTPEKLHAMIKSANPQYADKGQFQFDGDGNIAAVDLKDAAVSDLSPLKDLKLQALYLENTQVTDLSPLKNMRLAQVALSNTPVKDLSPLLGMPIRELRLVRTHVSDISALEGMPLEMLWLNDSPVEDISVLERAPLVSITLKGTKVKDISVVRTMPKLERLHIADTPITDLTPLAELPLTRLVFTPKNITAGIKDVRRIGSMQQIGTMFGDPDSDLTDPITFWKKYDEGAFK
ncbi:MAG: hypothetical protein GC159_06240 [Phycisphaera sp.]|nr:hypothetical protein [Phycisphaera sp.]